MSCKRTPQGIPTCVDDDLYHPWGRWAPRERKINGQGLSRQWFLWENREQKRHGLPFAGSHRESGRDPDMPVRSRSGKCTSSTCTSWVHRLAALVLLPKGKETGKYGEYGPRPAGQRAVPGVFNSGVTSMSYPVNRLWVSVACKRWVQVTWEFILTCFSWMRRPLEK